MTPVVEEELELGTYDARQLAWLALPPAWTERLARACSFPVRGGKLERFLERAEEAGLCRREAASRGDLLVDTARDRAVAGLLTYLPREELRREGRAPVAPISDPRYRAEAQSALVIGLVRQRQLDHAQKLLESIRGRRYHDRAAAEVARGWIEIGEIHRVPDLLGSILTERFQGEARAALVRKLVAVERTDEARWWAQGEDGPWCGCWCRDRCRVALAEALAAVGDLEAARHEAQAGSDARWRSLAQGRVVKVLAGRGEIGAAWELAAAIERPHRRAEAQSEVAAAAAERGDPWRAQELAVEIELPAFRDRALAAAVGSWIKAGDPAAAEGLAESLDDPRYRGAALGLLIRAAYEAGETAPVETFLDRAAALTDPLVWRDPGVWAESLRHVLAALPPELAKPVGRRALELVAELEHDDDQSQALASLAPRLPADRHPQALAVARTIWDPDERAEAILAMAPQLRTDPLRRAAFEFARGIVPERRFWMPGAVRSQVLDHLRRVPGLMVDLGREAGKIAERIVRAHGRGIPVPRFLRRWVDLAVHADEGFEGLRQALDARVDPWLEAGSEPQAEAWTAIADALDRTIHGEEVAGRLLSGLLAVTDCGLPAFASDGEPLSTASG